MDINIRYLKGHNQRLNSDAKWTIMKWKTEKWKRCDANIHTYGSFSIWSLVEHFAHKHY